MRLFFYDGFNKPKEITEEVKNKELILTDNYLGDVSEGFYDYLEYWLDDEEQMEEEQPFIEDYNIFVGNNIENFRDFNKRLGLEEDTYLEDLIKEESNRE